MHRRAAAPVREQSNNYVIERGLLICAASELTDPRDSHEGASSRGARGETATRAQNASFHKMRVS